MAAKAWLDANGFPNAGFASPRGDLNATALSVVRKYHVYYRALEYDLNSMPVTNTFPLKTAVVAEGVADLPAVRSALDQAVANQSWVILLTHGAYTPGSDPALEWFPTVINEVKSRNIPVATVRDALGGPYTFEARAYDAAGNSSVATATVTAQGAVITIPGSGQ